MRPLSPICDIVGDDGGVALAVLHLVQRQVEVIRLLEFTDALGHGGDVGATDRQTTAAEALHEPHGRQIKGQVTTQGDQKTAVQAVVLV